MQEYYEITQQKHYKITKNLVNKIKNGEYKGDDYVDICISRYMYNNSYYSIIFKPKIFMDVRINYNQILHNPKYTYVFIGDNIEIDFLEWHKTYNYYSLTKL